MLQNLSSAAVVIGALRVRLSDKFAYSGVASSIPARSHTFVEIEYELISTVILFPSAESFKKVCCQLHAKVCARSTG